MTQQVLAAGSARDREVIAGLLDNPNDVGLEERIGNRIDEAASAIGTLMQQRRLSSLAGERVGRDKTFRTSIEYPAFWTAQLDGRFRP